MEIVQQEVLSRGCSLQGRQRGAHLAQSEGLRVCYSSVKFLFPFCLEVDGIYQDQLGVALHIL